MQKTENSSVKIIPLGGLEQIGMNMTAFMYEDSIIVVDCGLSFPDDDMLGIDLVIPDVTFLKENIDKVKGFVVTHGHEDHIGAFPYVIKEVNKPIYATKLTMGIIETKFREHNLLGTTKRKVVTYGQSIILGKFRVEFIRTNHSIADSCALAIHTPAGVIFHTGDFKVDYTPVFGEPIDLQRFGEIGKKGVLALLCDSTNVMRPGYTMSEKTVGKTFQTIFDDNPKSRIIVATFASNVDRVQQIINAACAHGRKVAVEGRSMVNIINVASELGYLQIPDGTLIDSEEIKRYPDDKITIITTGSQGESMAALSRMAASIHKKVTIKPGDVIIVSATPIPGNEKSVARVINELSMKGAKVIFQDTHVSGHASQEEIKLIYSILKPKYAVPVHGEYRHLKKHADLAKQMGMEPRKIIIPQTGKVIELTKRTIKARGEVPSGAIMVDGYSVGDVGVTILRDRRHLAEDGILIVVTAIDRYTGNIVTGPDISTKGFVYAKESEALLDELAKLAQRSIERCLHRGVTDFETMQTRVRDELNSVIYQRTKRRPMIVPIFMDFSL